jgi:hypothetical protein
LRESLTILASILIAALTAALVGPWFVDWTQQRAFIEAQLSRAIGAPVETRGAIGLAFLPTPRLELGGLSLGQGGPASLRTGAVRLELAVTALLHGELRFLDASLEAPQLRIALDGAGALPSLPPLPDLQFERIVVKDGTLTLSAPGGEATFSGLDLQAEAAALQGPFRGAGSFARAGERVAFRFSTGAREGDRLRLKFVSDESAGAPRIDIDGALLLGARSGFEGPFILSGKRPAPWRAVGVAMLDPGHLALEPMELRLGAEAAPILLGGAARFILGPQAQGEVALSARQIDLDKTLAEASPDALQFVEAIAAPFPLRVTLASPATYLGGETITDLSLDARLVPGAPAALRLSGAGPGRSRILLDGQVEAGSAPRFRGQAAAEARDLARLGDWLAPALPQLAGALRASPVRSVEAAAGLEWSAAGFAAPKLTFKADRSSFSGAAAFTRPIGGERARLYADLSSDALDLDGMPDLSWTGGALADADIAIALDAKAIRVARFGEGVIDAGRIRLKLLQDSAGLRLENLSIAGLGGADVTASGGLNATDGALDVRVEAERLVDLAAFARRVAPGPLSDGLAVRAVSLSPLRLNLNLRAQREAAAQPLRLASLAFDATARGARWQAALKPEGGRISAESRDAPMLLRQLGVETLPLGGVGAATLQANVAGLPDGSYRIDASGLIAGIDLGFRGAVSGGLAQAQASGDLRLKASDAAPFLRLIGQGPPDITQSLPIDARAALTFGDGALALTGLTGSVLGVGVKGEITAKRQGGLKISGALDLDRANVPAFAALLLGAPAPARGALWSPARFGPGLAAPPEVDLRLRAGQVVIMEGITGSQASLRLALAPGVLALTDLTAALGQGRIAGRLALRRDGASVFMSGAGEASDQFLPGAWPRGLFDASLDFTATGESPEALVAGLAGTGLVRVRAVTLPQADPGAPARVMAEAEAGRLYISENDFLGALRRELDKAAMVLGPRDLDARLASGVLRLASSDLTASLDLRRMALEARVELPISALPKDWSEPAPRVALVMRGPFGAPQREIEAGPFINGLAVRAVARESARIEALEADLRERAFFARRKRGLDFLHRREREVAAYLAEQARLERLRPRVDIEKGEMERLIESLPQ